MKPVFKFARIGLLFLSVISMAFFAAPNLLSIANGPSPLFFADPVFSMLMITMHAAWMSGPFLFGYIMVRRDTADMPSIGLAVGLILPYLYYLFNRPRGGISAVMTVLSIPILAIVSGFCLAGLVWLIWSPRRSSPTRVCNGYESPSLSPSPQHAARSRVVGRQRFVLISGIVFVGVFGLVGWNLMRGTANLKKEYPLKTATLNNSGHGTEFIPLTDSTPVRIPLAWNFSDGIDPWKAHGGLIETTLTSMNEAALRIRKVGSGYARGEVRNLQLYKGQIIEVTIEFAGIFESGNGDHFPEFWNNKQNQGDGSIGGQSGVTSQREKFHVPKKDSTLEITRLKVNEDCIVNLSLALWSRDFVDIKKVTITEIDSQE